MRGRVADALDARDLGHVFEQQREIGDLAVLRAAAVGVHVLAEQRDFLHALLRRAPRLRSARLRSGRDTSSPRVYGTTQNVQYLLQPSMIETNAVDAFDARRRQAVELLDLGKRDVDLRLAASRAARRSSRGSRCSVCGPNTRSTYGARATIAAPSWLATQPPTPISSPGLLRFRCLTPAQIGEHFLLRLFAHRAGVEQDHVGLRP